MKETQYFSSNRPNIGIIMVNLAKNYKCTDHIIIYIRRSNCTKLMSLSIEDLNINWFESKKQKTTKILQYVRNWID